MSIMDKLKKNSKIKETQVLNKSVFFSEKDQVPTSVPMINVALSGDPDGGLSTGLTVLAGPSKQYCYFMIQSLVHHNHTLKHLV